MFRAYLIRSDLPRIIALYLKSTLSYNVTEGKGLIRAQISRSHLRIWPPTVTKRYTNVLYAYDLCAPLDIFQNIKKNSKEL